MIDYEKAMGQCERCEILKYIKPFLILVVILLSSCNYREAMVSSVSDEDVAFAKGYLSALKNGDIDGAAKYLEPHPESSDVRHKLEEATRHFPEGEPIKVDLVTSSAVAVGKLWRANLSFQYQFSEAWVMAHVGLTRKDQNGTKVVSFYVERLPGPPKEVHAFKLSGKSAVHYLFLAAAAAIPLFIVFTLVTCIRTPMSKKGRWVFFIFLGFLGLTINWTSGEIGYRLLSVQVFGVGASRAGDYSPWFITISLPLGAILFLLKHKRLSG